MNAELEILGCGPSAGTPAIACSCSICNSTDPKNKRLRASALFKVGSHRLLVDTSPDLRYQALRCSDFNRLDAVLFTHAHSDHILGLPELRSFFFIDKKPIPLYLTTVTADELKQVFHYIFKPDLNYLGMLPQFEMNEFTAGDQIKIGSHVLQSFLLEHGGVEVAGFRLGNLCYATDVKSIPEKSKAIIRGTEILILGAVSERAHPSHFSVSEAITAAQELGVKELYLTHLGHGIEFEKTSAQLPSWVKLCYDGMKIPFKC